MMLLSILVLVVAVLKGATGFNLDLNRSLTLQGEPNVHFGMAFSLFRSEVFVGAPADDNGQGALYHCLLSEGSLSQSCQRLTLDDSLEFEAMNLGASAIRIGSSTIVCAPLYKRDRYHSIQANMGKCFKATSSGLSEYFTLKSSKSRLHKTRSLDGWRTVSIMGRGLSTSTTGELVMGLPLTRAQDFNWDTERVTGSIGVVRFSGRKNFMVPKPERVPWGGPRHGSEADPRSRDATGVAIARGRFFSKVREDYAVGAPKSNKLKGRVFMCKACFKEDAPPIREVDRSRFILDGDQIGSRFGEAVIAVDLDGNGIDDIVVGAPLFSHDENKFDSGEVYVYRTIGFFFPHQFQRMTSIQLQRNVVRNGQFGASMSNLGDIDGDGFEDFVVGAPFEEGSGAVYLYRGHSDLQIGSFSQKITPANTGNPTMKGFGYSFSNVADVDANATPDFGIGALHSDTAVIIRTKRVVRISPKSTFRGKKLIEPNDNALSLRICAVLDKSADTNYRISINMIEADARIQVDFTKILFLSSNRRETCGSLNGTSKVPDFGVTEESMSQIPKPLKLRANLVWEVYEPDVNPLHASILSPESLKNELNVAYNIELKSICHNRACHCYLISSAPRFMTYIVGSSPNLVLNFHLANNGSEPAFNIIVFLAADALEDLVLNKESTRLCDKAASNRNRFKCNLGYLKAGSSQDYSIIFDVSKPEHFIKEDFTFTLLLKNSCSRGPPIPNRDVGVDVEYDYELKLNNHVEEPDLDYEEKIPRPFNQIFRIENTGPSPLEWALNFEIGVPYSPLLDSEAMVLSFDESFISCTLMNAEEGSSWNLPPEASSEGSLPVSCATEPACNVYSCVLAKGTPPGIQNLFLQLIFNIDSEQKDHTESYRILSFCSISDLGKVTLAGSNFDSLHRAQIKYLTEFVLPLAGGLLLGVILLVILFVILWKTGTFSKFRIYKNKLKEMEEETALFVGSPVPNAPQ